MELNQIKKKYGYPLEEHYLTMALKREDYHWLIEQAELVKRYEDALRNTYVEGMTIEEILTASDSWKQKEEIYKSIEALIDQWHESDSELPLHEYLGLTIEQYGEWLKTGELPNK